MSAVSIALFSTHGAATLRETLHSLRESSVQQLDVLVLASHRQEDIVTYLSREYLRGRISGFGFDIVSPNGGHCGLDRAFHMLSGDYIMRTDDDLCFEPGWLEKTVEVLDDNPDIGSLALVKAAEPRRRGRPPRPRLEHEYVDTISTRCFITRHSLFERHECELLGEQAAEKCLYQERLGKLGYRLAYLPGLVHDADQINPLAAADGLNLESDLPFHEGASGAMERLRQVYQIGDDVLVTCRSCGNNELEVLAAKIDFCDEHQVAVGHSYSLRCEECHELHADEDRQFRCPQ